jgi:hypothetical protein
MSETKKKRVREKSSALAHTHLGDFLFVQIVSRLSESLQTKGCANHDEEKRNAEQRGVLLQPSIEGRPVQWPRGERWHCAIAV